MNIWIFILSIAVIVLCLLLFYLYKWYNSSNLITRPITLQNNTQTISNLIKANTNVFSISVWIYANTLTISSTGTGGVIRNMIYSLVTTTSGISMYNLYFNGNELLFSTSINDSATDGKPVNGNSITKTFPLQKWTNVFVNVKETACDFFINGKLEQTYKVASDTTYTTINSMVVGSCSDDIYITNLQRWTRTTDAETIWNNYLNGLGFSLPTYNATLTYKQDNKIIQQNSLFSNSYK